MCISRDGITKLRCALELLNTTPITTGLREFRWAASPQSGTLAGMSNRSRRQSSSGSLIFTGLVLAVLVGMIAAAAGFDEGEGGMLVLFLGGSVAQAVLLTGIIAKGVVIGRRESQD